MLSSEDLSDTNKDLNDTIESLKKEINSISLALKRNSNILKRNSKILEQKQGEIEGEIEKNKEYIKNNQESTIKVNLLIGANRSIIESKTDSLTKLNDYGKAWKAKISKLSEDEKQRLIADKKLTKHNINGEDFDYIKDMAGLINTKEKKEEIDEIMKTLNSDREMEKIHSYQLHIERLEDGNTILEAKNLELSKEISDLEAKNLELSKEISDLEEKKGKLELELKKEYEELKEEYEKYTNLLSDINTGGMRKTKIHKKRKSYKKRKTTKKRKYKKQQPQKKLYKH